MGVVYGPLIMILFTTVLEVYLTHYRPGPPEVRISLHDTESTIEAAPQVAVRAESPDWESDN